MSGFGDWVLEQYEGALKKEPTKKEIKKVYKKQPRLSKSVVVYKPKLSFEGKKND
jgi:hypothetical protein